MNLSTDQLIYRSFLIYLALNLLAAYTILLTRTPKVMRSELMISATIFLLIPALIFLIINKSKVQSDKKTLMYSLTMVAFYLTSCYFYFTQATHFTNILLAINIMILLSITMKRQWVYTFSVLSISIMIVSIYLIKDNIIYYTSIGVILTTTYVCTLLIKTFKQYVLDLKNLNESLENKVYERTSELETMNEDLVQTMQHLNETQEKLLETSRLATLGKVIAGVAHEINTPLGVSVTSTSYLIKELEIIKSDFKDSKLSKSDFLESLDNLTESSTLIESSLIEATGIINQFKKVSPYPKDAFSKDVELKALLEDFSFNNNQIFESHNIKLEIDCEDITIYINPDILLEVLYNLLSNTITHGFKDIDIGRISIKVNQEKENVIFIFSNSGHKIPISLMKKIMEPFFTTSSNKVNKGLGLSIIHSLIVGVLGGTFDIKNIDSGGVEFIMTFPALASDSK